MADQRSQEGLQKLESSVLGRVLGLFIEFAEL